jgi:hypothetical protein
MSKYVLANVEIPIEIKEDGDIDTLHSYAQIEIIRQIQSPEEIVRTDLLPIQTQIDNLFIPQNNLTELSNNSSNDNASDISTETDNTSDNDSGIVVHKEEIKPRNKEPHNTTFKNNPKRGGMHNRTAKKHN